MPVELLIQSNIHNYKVFFKDQDDFVDDLAKIPFSCFVIDENVWKIYSENLLKNIPIDSTIILPISEERKRLETVLELFDKIIERPQKRNLTLVSFGGGILQDITGFAASTIYRGINWLFIPTTLLAQADSCIGSKTSLNYQNYKNLIGTFYPPTQIYIYPRFLQTLTEHDFYSGFGEVIKLHLMGGLETLDRLIELSPLVASRDNDALTKAIWQSLNVKIEYMSGDEFDRGRRNLLNFGHDFGHALESTSDFEVPHGQAVIFGMMAANIVSRQRGFLDNDLSKRIFESVLYPNLIVKLPPTALSCAEMINAMKKDKKRTGEKFPLILMNNKFEFDRVNDLIEEEINETLDELGKLLN